MSLPVRTLLALVIGLGLGVTAAATRNPALLSVATVLEPVGTLWVNAIRMTVIPLVVSLLLVGIASTEAKAVGRLGAWTIGFFSVLVTAVALVTTLVAMSVVGALPLGATLQAGAAQVAAGEAEVPGLAQWLTSLVPTNPIRAAADGSMIPLIVFTVAVGLAFTRLPAATAAPALGFFRALGEAMLVIVRWVLRVGPIGVFALSMSMGADIGLNAAGTVVTYVALVSLFLVAGTLALYPIAVLGGGIGLRRFAAACLAPQALGMSSRSSLASLPAMLESAERQLQLPARVTGFVLPFAVTVFKLSSAIALPTSAICFARLYGVDLGLAQVGTVVVGAFLMNVATPGIPSGGPLVYAPVFAALGIPIEAIGLVIAVDAVPDIFKTVINVTADMTGAVVVANHVAVPASAASPLAVGTVPA